MRGVMRVIVLLAGVAGCSDDVSLPGDEPPSPTEIAQDWLTYNCAVLDGELKCWADLYVQESSIPLAKDRAIFQRELYRPVPIPAIDFGPGEVVVDVAQHYGLRCAVLESGAVKCWGESSPLRFGIAAPTDDEIIIGDDPDEQGPAIPEVPLGTGLHAMQIETVGDNACVLFADGRVKCWGWGGAELGLGYDEDHDQGDDPGEMGDGLPFVDLGTNVRGVGLTKSERHCCVWTGDGDVKCWGANDRGQLGVMSDGWESLGDEPGEMGNALPFVDLGSGVRAIQVSAAIEHTCALTDDDRVKCWGGNSTTPPALEPPAPPPEPGAFGRLGLGDPDDRRPPLGDDLPFIGLGSDFEAIAVIARASTTCAVADDRRLKCWGAGRPSTGSYVELGDEPGEMGDALAYTDLGEGRTVRMIDRLDGVMLDNDSVVDWDGQNSQLVGDEMRPTVTRQDLYGDE